MIVLAAYPRSKLPADCIDLNMHIQNVLNLTVDRSNSTELFLYYHVTETIRAKSVTWATIQAITYRMTDDLIIFSANVLE